MLEKLCNNSTLLMETFYDLWPCESFGLYFVAESYMRSILIMYFNKPTASRRFCDEQELMKTNIKLLKVYHCLDYPEIEWS